jgi:hypothetical protein
LKPNRIGVQLHLSVASALAQTPAWQVSPVPQSSLVVQVLGTHWLFLHRAPGPQSPSAVQDLGVHLPLAQLEPAGQFWSVVHSGLGVHLLPWHTNPALQFASVAHSWHCPLTQTSL